MEHIEESKIAPFNWLQTLRPREWSSAGVSGLLLVFLFAAVIYTPGLLDWRSRVSFDGAFYLSEARYIYDGEGYLREAGAERLGRPPGFPALLAASFLPLGPSMVAAAWAVRIAGLVSILALGALAHRMFGLAVALLTLLWVVPNEFINEHLSHVILLDITQAAFLLLFLLSVYQAFKSASVFSYVLAAVSLGGAFWIKESALLFLPLPLFVLLLSSAHHSRRYVRGVLAYFGMVGALILPWFTVVFLQSGRVYGADSVTDLPALVLAILVGVVVALFVALGIGWRTLRNRPGGAPALVKDLSASDFSRYAAVLVLVLAGVVLGGVPLSSEIGNHFQERVSIVELKPLGYLAWVLIPLCWAVTIRYAWRKNLPDVVLLSALFCSIPLITFVIERNLDPRNYLFFLLISHLIIARVAVNVFNYLLHADWSQAGKLVGSGKEVAAGLAVGLLLAPPLIMLGNDLRFVSRGPDPAASNDVANTEAMVAWITENLPPGELIHISGSTSGAAARSQLGDAYRTMWVRPVWMQQERLGAGLGGDLAGYDPDLRPYAGLSGLVFVDINPSTFVGDREVRRPELVVLQVPDLLNGQYPRYLVWTQTGAERVLPDAMLAFILSADMARELVSWPNGDAILDLARPEHGNVLMVNERVLENFYDGQKGDLSLPQEIAANLSGWRVVIISALNDGAGSSMAYCPLLIEVSAAEGCWNGVTEYANYHKHGTVTSTAGDDP